MNWKGMLMKIEWLTTGVNPRVRQTGFDAGQRGWRLHALLLPNSAMDAPVLFNRQVRHGRALCGIQPAHGWGMDLFIDEPCSKCIRALNKRNLEKVKNLI